MSSCGPFRAYRGDGCPRCALLVERVQESSARATHAGAPHVGEEHGAGGRQQIGDPDEDGVEHQAETDEDEPCHRRVAERLTQDVDHDEPRGDVVLDDMEREQRQRVSAHELEETRRGVQVVGDEARDVQDADGRPDVPPRMSMGPAG